MQSRLLVHPFSFSEFAGHAEEVQARCVAVSDRESRAQVEHPTGKLLP